MVRERRQEWEGGRKERSGIGGTENAELGLHRPKMQGW